MKTYRWLSLIVLLSTIAGLAQSGNNTRTLDATVQQQLIGAWRLVWLEEPDEAGKVQRADCAGLLVYSRDSHMSVQVMYRKGQGESGAAPVQYAQGDYEASFGKYEIEDDHTFTFHVEGALVRTLIGKDLKRVYELSGNQLIVKSPDPNEHWRVAWERY